MQQPTSSHIILELLHGKGCQDCNIILPDTWNSFLCWKASCPASPLQLTSNGLLFPIRDLHDIVCLQLYFKVCCSLAAGILKVLPKLQKNAFDLKDVLARASRWQMQWTLTILGLILFSRAERQMFSPPSRLHHQMPSCSILWYFRYQYHSVGSSRRILVVMTSAFALVASSRRSGTFRNLTLTWH